MQAQALPDVSTIAPEDEELPGYSWATAGFRNLAGGNAVPKVWRHLWRRELSSGHLLSLATSAQPKPRAGGGFLAAFRWHNDGFTHHSTGSNTAHVPFLQQLQHQSNSRLVFSPSCSNSPCSCTGWSSLDFTQHPPRVPPGG